MRVFGPDGPARPPKSDVPKTPSVPPIAPVVPVIPTLPPISDTPTGAAPDSPVFALITAPSLGAADSYGYWQGDTITSSGSSSINGDRGLFPGSSVTGGPAVSGSVNVANASALAAKSALGTRTLTAGVYKDDGAPASLGIAAGQTLTLHGDASSVWIFQSASTLIIE